MAIVIGVRFAKNSKIYYFDPSEVWPAIGDGVICDTERGPEYGVVAASAREVQDDMLQLPLRKVLYMATEEDVERVKENEKLGREAMLTCKDKISEHNLEMKLIDVDVAFDNSKMVFYFTANGRVDFRELVKDLAAVFKTRIELRQIGVRDEAKLLGGLGPCGRPICCGSFLSNFQPVSIKMAKEQNLSLNPTKISGLCGRLMCCLKYEEDYYEMMTKRLPRPGRDIMTPDGLGVVVDIDVLREKVKARIQLPDGSFDMRVYEYADCSKPEPGARAAADAARAAAEKDKPPEPEKPERPQRPRSSRRELADAALQARREQRPERHKVQLSELEGLEDADQDDDSVPTTDETGTSLNESEDATEDANDSVDYEPTEDANDSVDYEPTEDASDSADYEPTEGALDVTDETFDDDMVDVGAEDDIDSELKAERELFEIAHTQNAAAEARFTKQPQAGSEDAPEDVAIVAETESVDVEIDVNADEDSEPAEPGDATDEDSEPAEPGDATDEDSEPAEPGDATDEDSEPAEPGDATDEDSKPAEPGDETQADSGSDSGNAADAAPDDAKQ